MTSPAKAASSPSGLTRGRVLALTAALAAGISACNRDPGRLSGGRVRANDARCDDS